MSSILECILDFKWFVNFTLSVCTSLVFVPRLEMQYHFPQIYLWLLVAGFTEVKKKVDAWLEVEEVNIET